MQRQPSPYRCGVTEVSKIVHGMFPLPSVGINPINDQGVCGFAQVPERNHRVDLVRAIENAGIGPYRTPVDIGRVGDKPVDFCGPNTA